MSLATETYWSKAVKYIPNGCQTYSKMPEKYVNGVYPKILISGDGCHVVDDSGKKYIDFISGLGAISLGYGNYLVDTAVKNTITHGQVLLSLPNPMEAELAERLSRSVQYAEQSKFFKTGSEACTAAIRAARAFTSKDMVASCGYHGWHDEFAASYGRKAGIAADRDRWIVNFKYNDPDGLRSILQGGNVAAIIMEPMVFDEPKDRFLENVRELTREHGAMLIFDECVTGFRLGHIGTGLYFNVKPDIAIFSKALGNGYPIAALCGRRDIMSVYGDPGFFVSGTYGGDLIGISAAMAVVMHSNPDTLWSTASTFKTQIKTMIENHGMSEDVAIVGYPTRTKFTFKTNMHHAMFWQECVKRGLLLGYSNFMTEAHEKDDLDESLNIMSESLDMVKKHWDSPKLEGEMPRDAIVR